MLRQFRLTGPAAAVTALLLWLCSGASAVTRPASACPEAHTSVTTPNCPQASDTTPVAAAIVSATEGEWTGTPSERDVTPPVISSLTLSPKAFRATQSGPSISIREGGTTVTYVLSEEARVSFTVQRAMRGVQSGQRCVKRTRSTAKGAKPCRRYVALRPVLGDDGTTGESSFRLNGRLAGARLKPGSYRLAADALDLAGNPSTAPVLRNFTILPPPKKVAPGPHG